MSSTFKKIIPVLLLSTAFAGVSSSALAAAPEADAVRGPTGSSEAFKLKNEIRNLVKFDQDIARKENAEKVLGTTGTVSAEVKEMRARLKTDVEAVAPKILLSPSISEQDAAGLIALLPANFSAMPAYLTAAAPKIYFLHECQADILKAGAAPTEALAKAVSECVGRKKEDAAPAVTQTVASPPETLRDTPLAKPQARTTDDSVRTVSPSNGRLPPARVEQPAPTPLPTTAKEPAAGLSYYMSPINIGIAGGALLSVIAGLVFLTRKKSGSEPQIAIPTTMAAPPPPPTDPAVDQRTVKLMDAPIKLKDGAAAPVTPPKRRDISL